MPGTLEALRIKKGIIQCPHPHEQTNYFAGIRSKKNIKQNEGTEFPQNIRHAILAGLGNKVCVQLRSGWNEEEEEGHRDPRGQMFQAERIVSAEALKQKLGMFKISKEVNRTGAKRTLGKNTR